MKRLTLVAAVAVLVVAVAPFTVGGGEVGGEKRHVTLGRRDAASSLRSQAWQRLIVDHKTLKDEALDKVKAAELHFGTLVHVYDLVLLRHDLLSAAEARGAPKADVDRAKYELRFAEDLLRVYESRKQPKPDGN